MHVTLYSLLQVTEDASPEIIEASYKALSKKYHPDNRDSGDAARFRRIAEAYAVLSDLLRRQEYDAKLKCGNPNPIGTNDPFQSQAAMTTVKRLDGIDTWCTIDEHVRRKGRELAGTCLDRVILRNVSLAGADLSGCRMDQGIFESVDLSGATLTGITATKATFKGVKFDGAELQSSAFQNCDFRGSSFAEMRLVDCRFTECLFDGVSFARLKKSSNPFQPIHEAASIDDCMFISCSMSATVFGTPEASDAGLSLSQVDFSGSNLTAASFAGTRIEKCRFDHAVLIASNFHQASLRQVDLRTCNLVNARFHEADMQAVAFPTNYVPVSVKKSASSTRTMQKPLLLDLGRGQKIELIWCPPGSFIMGSPESEKGREAGEDQHQVTLTKGFWIGKFPVTQGQWEAVMGANPSMFKRNKKLGLFGGETQPDHPVETVTWDECQSFIAAMNKRLSGARLSLPTEAQWEYACRAGTTSAYSFGDEAADLDQHAWFRCNSNKGTQPVGQKKPNRAGLFDMHGNVYEWCLDANENYPKTPVIDPLATSKGGLLIARGGSYYSDSYCCRSARRYSSYCGGSTANVGFRVVGNPV